MRLILGVLLLLGVACANASSFEIDTHGGRAVIREGGHDVLVFQLETRSLDGQWPRSSYVHPLFDLEGQVLTEDFPEDHRHQRGVFWAWHQLWVGEEWVADPWLCDRIEWGNPEVGALVTPGMAQLTVARDWVVEDFGRVVRETVQITVFPAEEDMRAIDFDLRFRALLDTVRLGGSDDDKGYGGFSTRIRLPDDPVFLGQSGEVQPQRTAVRGGGWMDVSGTYDGAVQGMTILVHPTNPGFPTEWILRASESQQNAAWPGREPVSLSTDTDLVLRYRLLIHRGRPGARQIETHWNEYSSTVQQNELAE